MINKRTWLVPLILAMISTIAFILPALAADDCTEVYGSGAHTFRLATGSPGELGLLKAIAEEFNPTADATLCWKKAGSGASLKLLKEKKVDMVMVHAPAAEKKAVEEGWAIKRNLIGSNEFYIVGPKSDPPGSPPRRPRPMLTRRSRQPTHPFFPR